MNYTIATLHQQHSDIYMEYGKQGDKFWVSYYDEGQKNYTRKLFDTAAEAIEVYLKIAGWILLGCYRDEDRRSYLLTGTMR